jgi:hypothetical protein
MLKQLLTSFNQVFIKMSQREAAKSLNWILLTGKNLIDRVWSEISVEGQCAREAKGTDF